MLNVGVILKEKKTTKFDIYIKQHVWKTTLCPNIMEVYFKVTTIGGIHFFLPW